MIVFDKTHALSFDGGHVSLGVHPDFDLSQALTFAAWVKPAAPPLQGTLLSKYYTAYEPQVQDGRWVFERGAEYAGSEDRVTADRWTHLAVTFDAAAEKANVRLYVDGVLDATHDVRTPLAKTAHALLMGRRPAGGDELLFRGQVAEMALWDTAHSAWRVKQEMNSRPDRLADDLVGWWAMDDAQGTTVSDRGPRGHHGTIVGAVSWVALSEPITLPTPDHVPLGSGFPVNPAAVPAGATQLVAAPRTGLPPSGRNGEACTFLHRAKMHARAQKQAQAAQGSARIQQARAEAAEQLDAAHRQAVRQMNTARLETLWFLHGARIHSADGEGRITRYASLVPQGPGLPAPGPEAGLGLRVDARTQWTNSFARVSPAVRTVVQATGTWTLAKWLRNVGPAGSGGLPADGAGYPLPSAPTGALLGRVGSRVFLIGARTVVPPELEGELELGANDVQLSDNSGSLRVTIDQGPPLPVLAADLAVDPGRRLLAWAHPFEPFTLYSADVDGTALRAVIPDPGAPVAAVAMDVAGQRIFFLTGDGVLYRVRYDGTADHLERVLELSGPAGGHRWHLAVDAVQGRVYWTGPLGVWSATLDGLDPGLVVPPHQAPAPVGVAVDGATGKVFWVDAGLHRVRRANLDGTGVEDLYDAPYPARGLALDEVSDLGLPQEVYWSAREERITPHTPGIAGYWPLAEGEGRTLRNRARPSVRSHLGSWQREADDLPPPMRPPDTAVRLSGGTDAAWLSVEGLSAVVGASFTLEMWIKPASLPAQGVVTLLWLGDVSPLEGLHLGVRDRKPYFSFLTDSDLTGETELAENRWTHLAFRYDLAAQQRAIFVDGVLDAAEEGQQEPLQGATGPVATVGRSPFGFIPFAGAIVGLHLTPRVMTEPQIRASRLDARPPDLLAALPEDPAWEAGEGPPVAVRPESVLAFRGAGHVALGTAKTLGLSGGSFTVELWVRPDRAFGDLPLVGTDGGGRGRGLHLLIRDGRPYLGFNGDDLAGTTQLAAGAWVHLAFRYDAARREQAIFVNGAPDARRTATGAFTGETTLLLGRAPVGTRLRYATLSGAVSDLRIWSVARTDEQIARNLRGYREQFAFRAAVDGSGVPERLFDLPSEGSLVVVSRSSAAHERRLLAYRARRAAQAAAAQRVAAAHADSDRTVGTRHEELEKAHQAGAAAVAAKKAEHEEERAGNRTRLAAAQGAATRRRCGWRRRPPSPRATGLRRSSAPARAPKCRRACGPRRRTGSRSTP